MSELDIQNILSQHWKTTLPKRINVKRVAPYLAKLKAEKVKKFRVELLRESDGKIYSRLIEDRNITMNEGHYQLVIDRTYGRLMDIHTVRLRAESLARLLGAKYLENLEWECVAYKKIKCGCPECIKAGRL